MKGARTLLAKKIHTQVLFLELLAKKSKEEDHHDH